jgi:integrase/recombinase XerC
MRVFIRWHEDTFNEFFDPSALTNYALERYRHHSLEVAKVKARTWNLRLWSLTHLCGWLEKPHIMQDIEAKAAGRPSTKHRSLTNDEYHRLIRALELNVQRALTDFERSTTVRTQAEILLMLHGLRVEETTLVEVEDITINERSGEVRVRNGKGSKERFVTINKIGRKAIASHLEVNLSTAISNLFAARTTRSLQRDVAGIGAQIGVPDMTPHWLRYTFAKRLERNGVALETIRDLLGHSTIEQTKRYLRSSAEELQSAVEGVM